MRKPSGYWTEERVIADLELIVEDLKHFPVDNELQSLGRYDLRVAIEKNGGISKFQRLMNYNKKRKPLTIWTEKSVIEELETLINKLGYLPTGPQLKKLNKGDLLNAINKFGGYIKFRIILSKQLQYNDSSIDQKM